MQPPKADYRASEGEIMMKKINKEDIMDVYQNFCRENQIDDVRIADVWYQEKELKGYSELENVLMHKFCKKLRDEFVSKDNFRKQMKEIEKIAVILATCGFDSFHTKYPVIRQFIECSIQEKFNVYENKMKKKIEAKAFSK